MKKIFTLLAAALLSASVLAQSPEKMSYQAVIRNSSDVLITDTQVGMQISILQGTASGAAVYVETQTPTTNANGLVSIEIGAGTIVSGDFSLIDWANGPYFIKTETDPAGGTSYTITGTSQLLSVPYALHAKAAENGITAQQANDITANNAKVGYTDALVSANADVVANTAKVGITTEQATAISDNTAKTGITAQQASDITANKAKVGITTEQADAITANTEKVGYTNALVSANADVVANTAKVSAATGTQIGELQYWDGSAWVILPIGQSGQYLQLNASNMPAWVGETATLITNAVSSLSGTYATCGGGISFDGGANITARGVCWSISPNPTTADNLTSDGTGPGVFTSYITGLSYGTKYFVRSYAMNNFGTSYGNEISFTTLTLPTITTADISSISDVTAVSGGNITNDGGAAVTARGVCWNNSTMPTIADSKTSDSNDIGLFTSSISGLASGTTYYVRAYAINSVGIVYGNEKSFTTQSLALLNTEEVNSITGTSAISGGNVTFDGGANITARGVCWSTSPNPTTADNLTSDGTGDGVFTSTISGLTENTTYYVRAYAISAVGETYGNEKSFSTLSSIPTLTTTAASIMGTTAVSGGNVTFDGGANITAHGVCWSTSPNPTIDDSKTIDGTGIGIFPSSLNGLTVNTTYYLRAYATNSVGTAYGNEISFTSLEIGQIFQGGKIAYILQPEEPGYDKTVTHGLIAALSDQSTSIQWYNGTTTSTGALGENIGTGYANTTAIIISQGAGEYAAKLCYDLELGGYSDWYLPSKDELFKLYINKDLIGGFADNSYWSSTEDSNFNYAWKQRFSDGIRTEIYKGDTYCVRAVRAF